MKYKERIIVVIVMLVLILGIRGYAILYYNYPPLAFPFFGLFILLVFWWLGKRYDLVKFHSENDMLTKIFNRRYVFHTFPKLAALMDRKDEKLIVFYFDIDDFKMINDRYGHETGDHVLKHFANLLVRTTSKRDIVARLAGDEFIIIAPFADEKGQDILINQINHELRQLFKEQNIEITVSIGTSVYPNDANTLDGLLNRADQNMYKHKSNKKNMIQEDYQEPFSLRQDI